MRLIKSYLGRSLGLFSDPAVSVVTDQDLTGEPFGVRASWLKRPIVMRVEGIREVVWATALAERLVTCPTLDAALDMILRRDVLPALSHVHLDIRSELLSEMEARSEYRRAIATTQRETNDLAVRLDPIRSRWPARKASAESSERAAKADITQEGAST